MATVHKSLSKVIDANGMAQVLFRIVLGRKGKIRIKTGVFVPVNNWNSKKFTLTISQKVSSARRLELLNMKEHLDLIEKRALKLIEIYGEKADKSFIENTLTILKDFQGSITKEIVDKMLIDADKAEKAKNNIFTLGERFLGEKNYSTPCYNNFRSVFRTMARYSFYCNKELNKPFAWDLDTTNENDINDYFSYLAKEADLYNKNSNYLDKYKEQIYTPFFMPKTHARELNKRGENSIIIIKKKVKTFWQWLIKKDYTKNNPFINIEIGVEKYGTPYYLTIEERNIIANFDLSGNKHLEIQRDIFIFQSLVGCRVGDLTKLTKDNIVNKTLYYTPHKTKDETSAFVARVPLLESAINLIERYKDTDRKGRLFPFISEQKYNDAIKEILTVCGITRKVNVRNPTTGETEMRAINEIASSHMARRTFIGNVYGVVRDQSIIGQMSGHVEGSKAFSRYRYIENDILQDAVNGIK